MSDLHYVSSENTAPAKKKTSTKHEVISWLLAIGIAVGTAFLIRAFLFEFVVVDGPSMNPTLQTDERIVIEKVSRYFSLPDRGEVVVVHYPNRTENFVKRVIGLPGETLEIRNSIVYINGTPLEEDYVNPVPYPDYGPVVVPEDHIFVMGDNRANSSDSRMLSVGAIPADAIVGHGLFVAWPFDSIKTLDQGTTYMASDAS